MLNPPPYVLYQTRHICEYSSQPWYGATAYEKADLREDAKTELARSRGANHLAIYLGVSYSYISVLLAYL